MIRSIDEKIRRTEKTIEVLQSRVLSSPEPDSAERLLNAAVNVLANLHANKILMERCGLVGQA